MPDARELLVSVVIPTRNGGSRLPIVLDALTRQTLPRERFEVVVADDASEDDTVAVAESYPFVRVARSDRRRGAPGNSNLGVGEARGPVIAFTDDDTVPEPDWLERGLARLAEAPSGMVAGHINLTLCEPPTIAALVDLGRGYLDQESYVAEGYGATANLWVRRDVLEQLGCFDERFLGQGHDRDFGERALAAGLKLVYADDVIVAHPARSRARDLARVAYRLGSGYPELRNNSTPRMRSLRPPYRELKFLRPWKSIWGIKRVRDRGYRPGLRERTGMRVLQYTCLQLPLVAGSVAGEIREVRAGRTREAQG
jgi:GT2 family glycosyltransferase